MGSAASCTRKEDVQVHNRTQGRDDIVVSGMSGRLPESANLEEFWQNLRSGKDMVTDDGKRWPAGKYGNPVRSGKLKEVDKFDASFFEITPGMADTTDPALRILLEVCYEAVVDSGNNPLEIRGSKTGVFIGQMTSDSQGMTEVDDITGFEAIGLARAMMANRISYAFDLKGPSMNIDTACSSALSALCNAVEAIQSGRCEAAIVGGVNILLSPKVTHSTYKLGMLSPDGACKSFDESGNGYVRSEGVVAVYVQKKAHAKRVYAHIIDILDSSNGSSKNGITYPSGDNQFTLMSSVYKRTGFDPSTIDYVEAHGTGTKAGDPEECNGITRLFCENRTSPLLIGSVKSNIGHTEGAAGLASLIKVLLAMKYQELPGNLHFNKPNANIPGLLDGRLKVVDKLTPFHGAFVAVNSFGFGGSNVHVILQAYRRTANVSGSKTKEKKSKRSRVHPVNLQLNTVQQNNSSKLFVISGRNKSCVESLLKLVQENPTNEGLCALLCAQVNILPYYMPVRGYTLLGLDGSIESEESSEQRPIWFIFPGMGSQWSGMGEDLFQQSDVFRGTIERCHRSLMHVGFDLVSMINNRKDGGYKDPLFAFVGITAIQIALVMLLMDYGIEANGFIGHSLGELACGFADGGLTEEQTILAAYWRGKCIHNAKLPPGKMAAIGVSWDEATNLCHDVAVVPACHNDANNVTVSGYPDDVDTLVEKVKHQRKSGSVVDSAGIAFHSPMLGACKTSLQRALAKIIKTPKPRTSRWISSSVPESEWESASTCSAEYHVNNFLSPVLFYNAVQKIPANALCIVVGPHGLFKSILKKVVGTKCTVLTMMDKRSDSNWQFCLNTLGRCHINGVDFPMNKLHGKVAFPVSSSVPIIAPSIKWEHERSWMVLQDSDENSSGYETTLLLNTGHYLLEHNVNGQTLYPAAGLLVNAWEAFAKSQNTEIEHLPVTVEDFNIVGATILPRNGSVKLRTQLSAHGRFEITENDSLRAEGKISSLVQELPIVKPEMSDNDSMSSEDIYQSLRIRGYEYGTQFQCLKSYNPKTQMGSLAWQDSWITHIDGLLHLALISDGRQDFRVPVRLHKVHIQPTRESSSAGVLSSRNLCIEGIEDAVMPYHSTHAEPFCQSYQFVPYVSSKPTCTKDTAQVPNCCFAKNFRFCLISAVENMQKSNILIVVMCQTFQEIADGEWGKIMENELPGVQVGVEYLIESPFDSDDSLAPWTSHQLDLTQQTIQQKVESSDICIILQSAFSHVKTFNDILKPHTFVVTVDDTAIQQSLFPPSSIIQIADLWCKNYKIMMFRKAQDVSNALIINTCCKKEFEWVADLKEALPQSNQNNRVWLVSDQNPFDGIIGLVNSLRMESGGEKLRCAFITDKATRAMSDMMAELKVKDLVMNVYKNGQFGRYHHIRKAYEFPSVKADKVYLDALSAGDIDSLTWVTMDAKGHKMQCEVHCVGLSHRDISVVNGSIQVDDKLDLGAEFAGKDTQGNNVFGVSSSPSLCSECSVLVSWPVPAAWTLEQAATVPLAYSVAFHALKIVGQIEKGSVILFHGEAGTIAQASVHIARKYDCTVLVMADNPEEGKIWAQQLKIEAKHIFNPHNFVRDMSKTLSGTNGVDAVISLDPSALQQSALTIIRNGGKCILINSSSSKSPSVHLGDGKKDVSIHIISMERFLDSANWKLIRAVVQEGIDSKCVVPLQSLTFGMDTVKEAFGALAERLQRKKIVIKVHENERKHVSAIHRTQFDSGKSYIVTGGLGGLGLELCNWLVQRGVRHIIITSRSGVSTGYQRWKLHAMTQYGADVKVEKHDCCNYNETEKLIADASRMAPVGGIFHLAAVIEDGNFDKQSPLTFTKVCKIKIDGVTNLDKVTRAKCVKSLDWFVAFSSIASGMGNSGQSNYAYANSGMERIVEQRVLDQVPGVSKAFQWGLMGDVGIVQRTLGGNTYFVQGSVPQRVPSFLNTMEIMLQTPGTVLSSVVPNRKTDNVAGNRKELLATALIILDIKDASSMNDDVTLLGLGADSLKTHEIHQILGREFNIPLKITEVEELTIGRLKELGENR